MNAPELHKREEMPELYARGAEGAPWITNVGPQRTRSSDTEAAGDREVRGGLDANRSVFQKRTAERRLQDRRPTAQRESRATLRIKTLRGEPLSLNTVSSDGLFSVNSVSELCVLCGECIGWFRRWIGVCFLFVTFALCSTRAAVPIKVSGLGWMHDREMRVSLAQLTGAKSVEVLDSNSIEDAAVILTSALNEEGFQRPEIDVAATLVDGTERKFRFDPTFTNPVPRPLKARELHFTVRPGVRWRIANVAMEGLTVMPEKNGRGFFRTESTLLVVARTNAYSKSQLNRSENALLDDLKRRGYAEATVRAEVAGVDEKSGAVTVHVDVNEGPHWQVDRVRIVGGESENVTLPA